MRFGTEWLRFADAYDLVLRVNALALRKENNPKAARILEQHRRLVPTTVPYELHIEGHEWPLIASALLRCRKHSGSDGFRKLVQNLYAWLGRAKRGHAS